VNRLHTGKVNSDEADDRPRRICSLRAFLTVLMLGFLALAVLLLSLNFVSFDKAKTFCDWYLAAHGIPERNRSYFTEEIYNNLGERLPIIAGVFGVCAATLGLFRERLVRFLLAIPAEWPGIRNSLRNPFQARAETVLEIFAVVLVFAVGIFLRLWHLGRAVRVDEAWTYVEFASRPLVLALSNYRAPNNHLLNTLLVHFSTRLFGNTLYGLRFPAFVAGCLVIVASWFVTRALYGQIAGILAAGCVAALPTFIEFSVNARGYALQWLSVLAMTWLSAVLQENPSLKVGWVGFVLAGVAGVYSIPTTLIAIAGVFAWMLVSTFADGGSGKLKSLSGRVALAGSAIGLLSILLYVPPFFVRGSGPLMAKEVVMWQQSNFVGGLKEMGRSAWRQWSEGVPAGLLAILFGGLMIGLLFSRKIRGHRVLLTVALCLSAAIFVWVRHVFGFPRVWSYLLLSAVMTACGGLSLVLSSLAGRSQLRRVVLAGAISVTLAVFVGAGVIKERALFTSTETGRIPEADQIVDFLLGELRTGDSLVSNPVIEYELLRRNPKLYNSLRKPREAERLVAVVYELATLATRPDLDLQSYTPPQVRAKFLTSTVYFLERRHREPTSFGPRFQSLPTSDLYCMDLANTRLSGSPCTLPSGTRHATELDCNPRYRYAHHFAVQRWFQNLRPMFCGSSLSMT
jgi:hypothetical protein